MLNNWIFDLYTVTLITCIFTWFECKDSPRAQGWRGWLKEVLPTGGFLLGTVTFLWGTVAAVSWALSIPLTEPPVGIVMSSISAGLAVSMFAWREGGPFKTPGSRDRHCDRHCD